jgi:type II secretory pathway predicted ATPase ExeA
MTSADYKPMRWGSFYKGISGLDGVRIVESPGLTRVRLRMMETIELGGMMRVSGPVGHGKSFATARSVEACAARHPDLAVTWVELAGVTRGRGLAAALYEQIIGSAPQPKSSLAQLRVELVEHFVARRHLIICDEAQHVSNEAMHLIRWMYDADGSQLIVVFCGVAELRRPFPPEINSRLLAHVSLDPIPDDDAALLLRQMHPVFERMDDRLIKSANKREAQGEWRWWCKFLARAATTAPREVVGFEVHR